MTHQCGGNINLGFQNYGKKNNNNARTVCAYQPHQILFIEGKVFSCRTKKNARQLESNANLKLPHCLNYIIYNSS